MLLFSQMEASSTILQHLPLPFIADIVGSWLYGVRAVNNPWHATGLEWMTTSPPPRDNFEEIPVVRRPPYDYGDPKYSVVEPTDQNQ